MSPAPVGSAVLYWSDGALSLGRVAAEEKQRLRVERPRGGDERITAGRIALVVGSPSDAPVDRQALRTLDETIRQAASAVDVPLLWSLVREDADEPAPTVDLERLGPLAVDDVAPGVACAATLIAIRNDRLHFERRGASWRARSEDAVAALRAERERVERRERESAALHDALERAVRDGAGRLPESETARAALAALRGLAVDESALDAATRVTALDALRASGQAHERPEEGAFRLLRRLGVWTSDDENLQLERFAIRVAFPTEVERRASEHASRGPSGGDRLDLTALPTCSIDGPATREIDDALSVDAGDAAGPWIWIHIADPSALVEPGDAVDLEAAARGLSHYMPDHRIPMMPAALSERAASLVEGDARPALSFGVRLDAEGRVTARRVERTVVRCDARLTYDEADARLAGDVDGPWSAPVRAALLGFAERRRRARLDAGALLLDTPDVDLRVAEDGSIVLDRVEASSPSRAIVGEAMVLAGSIAAETCRDAEVPVFYRTQPGERGAPAIAGPVVDPLEIARRRRGLRRAEVGLRPGRHSSLGVDAYCQATSPLRRYQDLICHRQLLAAIRGEAPPYSEDDLRRIAATTAEAERAARRAENAARDYWRLRWLERRGDRPVAALVLESAPRPRVLLDELQSVHAWPGAASLEPGRRLALRVTRVNPRAGVVRFDRAEPGAVDASRGDRA